MPKFFRLIGPVGLSEVKRALHNSRNSKDTQRLIAVRMGLLGMHTMQQVAKIVGVARSTLGIWAANFRRSGISGLLERHYNCCGRKTIMGADIRQELLEGLRQGRWKRAKEIQGWLRQRHQVKFGLKNIYYWLGKCGGVLKVPRKTHIRKNAVQVQAFRNTLAEQLQGLNLGGSKNVRIWAVDEHRYGLIGIVRKCWTLKGHRPTAPYHTKYQWGYLYSALEVDGENRSEAFFSPRVCLEASRAFLEQIAARDGEAEHVIIWDQAGFHPRVGNPIVPSRIHLIALPAYSPELNPVEKIGDLIKDRIGNTVWQTLDEIEAAIEQELQPIWKQADRVRELIGNGWLLHEANASVP